MYTQCNNCQAIFRVTMKELSTAQGLLRCGECGSTFDAMKALSTTLPEDRKFIKAVKPEDSIDKNSSPKTRRKASKKKISSSPLARARELQKSRAATTAEPYAPKRQHKSHSTKFLLIALVSLSLLLLAQVLYKQKDWLATQSTTSEITRALCSFIPGCEVEKHRDITKIEMLNKNIYSHPNQPGSLVVSASLENTATFEQPFPLIEISLLDSKSEIVALRRFTPKEYLDNKFEQGILMTIKAPIELKLNIADPGRDAVRFQFKFL